MVYKQRLSGCFCRVEHTAHQLFPQTSIHTHYLSAGRHFPQHTNPPVLFRHTTKTQPGQKKKKKNKALKIFGGFVNNMLSTQQRVPGYFVKNSNLEQGKRLFHTESLSYKKINYKKYQSLLISQLLSGNAQGYFFKVCLTFFVCKASITFLFSLHFFFFLNPMQKNDHLFWHTFSYFY